MKESPFLFAVQRQVGGVYVLLLKRDLLVSIFCARAQLQPVQRALACQRFGEILLTGKNAKYRIRAQLLVIVQVFVAEGKTVNPCESISPIECSTRD